MVALIALEREIVLELNTGLARPPVSEEMESETLEATEMVIFKHKREITIRRAKHFLKLFIVHFLLN